MAEAFLSASWHRVADLAPRLRGQADVVLHRYRGQSWYVMSDPASGRVHRFTPAAYVFIRAMDGQTTVDAIWSRMAIDLEEAAPTQDEIVRLLSQLYEADMLQIDRLPHAEEFVRLVSRQRGRIVKSAMRNPLAVTVPLWDPDDFLGRTVHLVRPLFSRAGLIAWLALVCPSVLLAVLYYNDLTESISDRILSAEGLALIALTYPVVKALHELGHAYAVKVFGGEVHQIGVMLIAFYPVPFVDASASAMFPDKSRRALVAGAGIMVELALASLALAVWLAAEPGLFRALAFDVIIIAGVSTVLINGNPLLRFDGYFILGDLIEIPNLAQRSTRFWGRLLERHVLGTRDDRATDTLGERIWFSIYAPVSFVYRIGILISIAMFIANKFFVIGVLLAIVSLVGALVVPLWRGLRGAIARARLGAARRRVVATLVAGPAAVAAVLFLVPIPLHTNSQGIIWLPEAAYVRAGADGFVTRLASRPGARVARGDLLIESADPVLERDLRTHRLRLRELEIELASERFADRVQAHLTDEELAAERERLASDLEREARLGAHSDFDGTFVTPRPDDLPGRYFRKGEVLGYVLPDSADTVRVVVSQGDIALVRNRLRGINVRTADASLGSFAARIAREVPAANDELPSKALSTTGGGNIAVDPADAQGAKAMTRFFQVDLALDHSLPSPAFGARTYVRFEHAWEPVALQVYRRLRQLFLSRFSA